MSFTRFRSCAEVGFHLSLLSWMTHVVKCWSSWLIGWCWVFILPPGHAASGHFFVHNSIRYASNTLRGALWKLVPLKSLTVVLPFIRFMCTWENSPELFPWKHVYRWIYPSKDCWERTSKIFKSPLHVFRSRNETFAEWGIRFDFWAHFWTGHVTSTFQGWLSNSQIPVPCPVLAIVKQRKVQGSEYYEVSWRNIDGLQVSVVPGELVRR